jgi:hypothetical protein
MFLVRLRLTLENELWEGFAQNLAWESRKICLNNLKNRRLKNYGKNKKISHLEGFGIISW